MLSGRIAKKFGKEGLPEDTIVFNFKGSAGQSFGAFGMKGLTLKLVGDVNDYVGKGLSGAKIIIETPENAAYRAQDSFIAGNTILYGATSGKLFVNGMAGERFGVRNSGALAVVEGVGDHCCEYMTGGTIVVIGSTGRNFGAGMTGGVAYVLDEKNDFSKKCNMDMIEINELENDDESLVYDLIKEHHENTNSSKAKSILDNWDELKSKFRKVIPTAYKRILAKNKQSVKVS